MLGQECGMDYWCKDTPLSPAYYRAIDDEAVLQPHQLVGFVHLE
jgi:hypothetical protein